MKSLEIEKSILVDIAEILERRANEVASYHYDYKKDPKHFGSVEMALSREVERLRDLANAITPDEPEEEVDTE